MRTLENDDSLVYNASPKIGLYDFEMSEKKHSKSTPGLILNLTTNVQTLDPYENGNIEKPELTKISLSHREMTAEMDEQKLPKKAKDRAAAILSQPLSHRDTI